MVGAPSYGEVDAWHNSGKFQINKCRGHFEEQRDRQKMRYRIGKLEQSYEPTKHTSLLKLSGAKILVDSWNDYQIQSFLCAEELELKTGRRS